MVGGGGSYQGADGSGGTGGGGNGGDVSVKTPGTANTGGGGGGSDDYIGTGTPPANSGAAGGSGIVVIRLASVPHSFLEDKVGGNTADMYNGTCVDFDGTDAWVVYGDVTFLDGLSTVSVSCWLYLDQDPPNNTAVFVAKDNTLECVVKRSSGNEYSMSINNEHQVFTSAPVPVYGEWTHVVMTWTNTNLTLDVRKLYLNGELVDTYSGSGIPGKRTLDDTGAVLGIAARGNGDYEIDGQMSDVKIFAKELSAANVKELYDDSKVIIPTQNDGSGGFLSQVDLLLWVPLAEGAGSIAYDGSGRGNDGTYTGSSFLTGQTGAPQLVEGYNRPMWFDDTNDYVAIGTTNPMQFIWSDNFSLSAWIYCDTVTGFKHIMGKTYGNYRFAQNGGNISLRLDTNVVLCEASGLSVKKWHHVVATYATNSPSAGGTAALYLDGVYKGSCANSSLDWTATGGTFQIGNSPGESYYFGGIINECIAYDKTLSLAEVQALANTDANGGPLPPDAMTMGSDVAEQISAKSSNAVESTYSYGGTTYKTWTYRSSGTFVVPRKIDVDVVIVGGGGGGGFNVGGGGGAGGLVSESLTAGASSYTVTVGAGGEGMYSGKSPAGCTSGEDSSINIASATTAVGGGRAGGYSSPGSLSCQTGGSGGASAHAGVGCAGTAGQGNTGGSGTTGGGHYAGGGGGGAGAAGANAVWSSPNMAAGDGGNGKNDFINSSVAETAALLAAALPTVGGGYLAGGGGGSLAWTGTVGAGGSGGGGRGSNYGTADGENGQPNTGGGGGGEMDGGSGVVIVRYAMPSPIGYWRNDGASTWTDLSGNGNNGTVAGSPDTLLFKQGYTASKSTDEGRDNQGFPLKYKNVGAVGFNGSDTYINLGFDPSETGRVFSESAFTVSAWVKSSNTTPGGGASDIQNIVGFPNNNVGHFCIYTDGKLGIWSYGGSAWRFSNTPLTSNQWHHVVLVFDGDDGAFYYLDGVADSAELEFGGTAYQKECNLRYIGAQDPSRYFNGQIANTQVYNRALTQTEIKQNFAAQANRFQVPRSIVTEGLVLNLDAGNPGSYPGSGTAWYDVSGNGCDFTLDGSGITYSASNGGIFSLTDPSNGGASTTSAITASTSCTLVFWMKTTDGQALFWSGPAVDGGYLGAYRSGNKFYNAAALGGASPTFYTNAVQRSNIYDFIRTGEWMMMEFKSVDMSSLTASHFNQYASYTFGGSSAVGKIMIYNRNLTSAESAQNFRVDRERFGV